MPRPSAGSRSTPVSAGPAAFERLRAADPVIAALIEQHGAAPELLRGAGLSRAKVAYLRDLAEHVEDRDLELDRLVELQDEEVAAQLTAVKGLGRWTADMFLIFHL